MRIRIAEARAIRRDGEGFLVDLGDEHIHGERVIVAAGVDTPALLPELGLPIESAGKHLFYSDPLPAGLLRPLVVSAEREFAAKQLADGRLLASDLAAAGDPVLRPRRLARSACTPRSASCCPRLAGTEFPTVVSGEYDSTPDSQPIVGPVGPDDGLFVAAGFSGHGFMLAPAIGRRLADVVLGTSPRPRARLVLARPLHRRASPRRAADDLTIP